MTKKLSRTDAALWLSEAWGRGRRAGYQWLSEAWGRGDIRPSDVCHVGNWLFHHDPDWPGDVTCIHAPKTGDIWAEPWDDIRFIDSPFVEKDKEKLSKTLAKLDNEIGKYIADCNGSAARLRECRG